MDKVALLFLFPCTLFEESNGYFSVVLQQMNTADMLDLFVDIAHWITIILTFFSVSCDPTWICSSCYKMGIFIAPRFSLSGGYFLHLFMHVFSYTEEF